MKRVFITGVTGFLGAALARCFHGLGWAVRGSTHAGGGHRVSDGLLEAGYTLTFNGPFSSDPFFGCDAVIHCAFDPTPGALSVNETGVKAIYNAAEQAGVTYQLFVSSHSARPDAVSEYGLLKYRLESFFLARGQAVVRPGLIVGPGGMFGRIARFLSKKPVLVLPGVDLPSTYYISLRDLLTAMVAMVESSETCAANLFVEPALTLRDFSLVVAQAFGHRPSVLSVPITPLFLLTGLLGRIMRPLPTSLTRLETMRLNVSSPLHSSDLSRYVSKPEPLAKAVAVAAERL